MFNNFDQRGKMKKKILSFSFLILFSANVFANIGSRPFHSTGLIGNVFTLNPSFELDSDSVNLIVTNGSGNLKYKGSVEYDFKLSELAVTGNSKLESGIIGYGYSNETTEVESNVLDAKSGFQDKQKTVQTNYSVGYLHITDQLNYFGAFDMSSYNYERTYSLNSSYYWTSTGTSTKSDSVTVGVNTFHLGALYKSTEEVSFGGMLTSAAGGKGKTDDPEAEVYFGNGNQLRAGIGYNTKKLSIGVDIVHETENKDYLVNAYNELLLDAYFLLQPDISIKCFFSQTQSKELTKDGTTYPSSNETDIGAGIKLAKDQMIFGAEFVQGSITYDAKEKGDIESGNVSITRLTATYQF
jgi:hypothetical protein